MHATLQVSDRETLHVEPASPCLGADVHGIDVAALVRSPDRRAVDSLKSALDRHLVLRFRQPALTNGDICAFGALFGSLLGERQNPEDKESAQLDGYAELKVISNAVADDGRMLGDKGAEPQIWHTDGAHRATPNAYSLLYARKVPPNPPRTGFLSAYALYESLPASLKDEIAGLRAVFSVHNRSQSFWTFMEGPSVDLQRRADGPTHPLVRLHPNTRRPFLYLPRRRDALVVGLSPQQSRELLERLWAAVFLLADKWFIALAANDFVIFDNRVVLHNREGWDATQERIVFHLAIEGEVPLPAFPAAPDQSSSSTNSTRVIGNAVEP
jgi:taurine dioxygenase